METSRPGSRIRAAAKALASQFRRQGLVGRQLPELAPAVQVTAAGPGVDHEQPPAADEGHRQGRPHSDQFGVPGSLLENPSVGLPERILELFDDPLLFRHVQEADELLFSEVRGSGGAATCYAARDECDRPQDGSEEARQPVDRSRRRQGDALGVGDGQRLGRHLGSDEQDDGERD